MSDWNIPKTWIPTVIAVGVIVALAAISVEWLVQVLLGLVILALAVLLLAVLVYVIPYGAFILTSNWLGEPSIGSVLAAKRAVVFVAITLWLLYFVQHLKGSSFPILLLDLYVIGVGIFVAGKNLETEIKRDRTNRQQTKEAVAELEDQQLVKEQ